MQRTLTIERNGVSLAGVEDDSAVVAEKGATAQNEWEARVEKRAVLGRGGLNTPFANTTAERRWTLFRKRCQARPEERGTLRVV